ncbi:MAG TPA: flagellar basal body P-ring formation chaperone FlgA [Candidatus Acidoferrum sp.]|nr:flagellar basal body P-ring formation chaperone FlgA [Candidatus Acidoferrum sp.]
MKSLRIIVCLEVVVALFTMAGVRAATCSEAVVQQVMTTNNLDPKWYQIEVLDNPLKTTEITTEKVSILPLSQKEPLGLYTVLATLTRDGAAVESGQIKLKIRKFAEVLVANGTVDRHETPSPEKFTLQRMDVTSLLEQPVGSLENVARLRLKRNLSKGQILTANAVEPVPDIDVGREVSIICSNGLYTVTAAGVSMQPGSAGDLVRVRNKASGKIVIAKVVDEATVAVNP